MKPISRKRLIRTLKKFGFQGPRSGGKHDFMERGQQRVRIPNPHGKDIGVTLLFEVLSEAQIGSKEWESALRGE